MLTTRLQLTILIIVSLIPGVLLANAETANPFLYQNITTVTNTIDQGVVESRSDLYIPAHIILLSAICEITDIDPDQVIFLPLGSLILPVAGFVFARRLTSTPFIPLLFGIYLSWDGSLSRQLYSVFPYDWTYPLYLIFLIFILTVNASKWTAKRNLILMLVFVGSITLHYTPPVWMLIALAIVFFSRARNAALSSSPSARTPVTGSMLVLFTVAYLTMNSIFYRLWIPMFAGRSEYDTWNDPVQLLYSKVRGYFSGEEGVNPYEYAGVSTETFGPIRLVIYTVIAFCTLLWILKRLKVSKYDGDWAGKPAEHRAQTTLMTIFIITLVADAFMYSAAGVISTKYVIFIGPIAAVSALSNGKRRRQILIMSTIVMLSLASFASLAPIDNTGATMESIQPGASWLQAQEGDMAILTDLTTGYKLKVYMSSPATNLTLEHYNSTVFDWVVGGGQGLSDEYWPSFDFIVIDEAGTESPTMATGWVSLEPIYDYEEEISRNSDISTVYSDGVLRVMMTT